ncbi:sugar ABC transporter ATP-binding protein [uncultured Brachyspira sp.]|uniref:sugar ABC transporter ATP-binding protein n=1 Tax=uncultured Brachyspira sp. TaxID=221953 RepID=UPI0026126995|nr:sugar ABC transporter ATP-binding protein [uncultured Brachyspira sp.]
MENKQQYLLEATGINKTFGGTKALDDVQIHIKPASVHGLMGENGAGKSTLMKVIMGIIQPDSGTLMFDGKHCHFTSPRQALEMGIVMIHQELSYIPYRSVCENLYLNREPLNKFGLINHKKMYNDALELLKSLNFDTIIGDPKKLMTELTVSQQQMVEIAKAVSYNAKLVIMDEPSSAITEKEIDILFHVIRDLKSRGISIIYTTHKMEETYKIVDDITILRDGKWIATGSKNEIDNTKLINYMVGRSLDDFYNIDKTKKNIGEEIIRVENLSSENKFKDVSFSIRRGEILGFAGLVGSGRTEIAEAIFGIRKLSSGKIFFNGNEINIKKPIDAIKNKIAFITEDRKVTGIYPMLSVANNMTIVSLNKFLSKLQLLNYKVLNNECENLRSKLSIKMSNINIPISSLSGGNQQKVLLARWMIEDVNLFIFDEPTRGIDIGAKTEIYQLIRDLANRGCAVMFISSEMPEIIANCDRVVVMNSGNLMGILDKEGLTQEKIMTLAAGMEIQK